MMMEQLFGGAGGAIKLVTSMRELLEVWEGASSGTKRTGLGLGT